MKTVRIALIGNPNCGKSTLFNALTGGRQKVGNWPGVTVERKSGHFTYQQQAIEVIDLPGVYSLTAATGDSAIDSRIARKVILSHNIDVLVSIVDGSNLERHLYLTAQLLEMNVPMLVAVNMLDVAEKRGFNLDLTKLAEQLGCPVVGLSAARKKGLEQLKQAIVNVAKTVSVPAGIVKYPSAVAHAIQNVTEKFSATFPEKAKAAPYLARHWLEGGSNEQPQWLSREISQLIEQQKQNILQQSGEEVDLLIADARYTAVHSVSQSICQKSAVRPRTSAERIDKIVLNRFLGIPIFLAAMYFMFFFAINIGGAFQGFFDQASDAIFVRGLAQLLNYLHFPNTLIALITLGIGKGINTVVTFIPIIGCLFLWLSFLESSGYMARAAFVIDRIMRAAGLPGKAFVPLIVGFGCNVPAILATRTLEHSRDRLLTMMMTPFMSCGARLAIYAVFTAAFFPTGGQNVVFALYIIGILMAVMTGLVLRRTVLQGESSPWVVELPPYHFPTLMVLLRSTWHRLKGFIFKAGKYIIPVCFLIGGLNAITINGQVVPEPANGSTDSILSVIGKTITPVFAPMGIQQDNWPATVGLMSGVLAKEVVVGTLNTLYAQAANLPADKDEDFHFVGALTAAAQSIPQQLVALKDSFSNPIAASGGDGAMNAGAMGVMVHFFDGKVGAMAYLLFVLLYFPCISATAAMVRESSRRWAFFSVSWTTGLAYIVAVIFYQAATWAQHPLASSSWIIGLGVLFGMVLWGIRQYANQPNSMVLKPT